VEHAPVIAGLLAKREEIAKQIAELERQIRKHKAEIAQIDGTIGLFAPDVKQAKREVTRFARSAHVFTEELSRLVQKALREADGWAITADEIAVQAMREKGLDMGDGELRADITRRFLWTLNRLLARGEVTKEGWGAAAKWGAPSAQASAK
jgi:chromosome segregation ATPase